MGENAAVKATGEKKPGVVSRILLALGLDAARRLQLVLCALMIAFASVFLVVGWIAGPQVLLRAHQYAAFTGHVDARIVDSWLALEFDPSTVRNQTFWRASTQASRCVVAEYGGDWGAPLRRAFCGIRVPFNESYALADLRDIAPGVAFTWPLDARGFVVPQIRMERSTRDWLAAHQPNRFMHAQWPAQTSLDWLRVELDRPVDHAAYGWTTGPAVLPLAFDPAHPEEALPAATVATRLADSPNWIALAVGFGIGLFVWFKATAILPVLSGVASIGRWLISAVLLVSLPWWTQELPRTLSHVNKDLAYVLRDMYADVERIDRLVATEPAQATLVDGDRLTWRLEDSLYADALARVRLVRPEPPPASPKAAMEAIAKQITASVHALDDAQRRDLRAALERYRKQGLTGLDAVFDEAPR
jgi:type IV secretory pathway VirB3-like protein